MNLAINSNSMDKPSIITKALHSEKERDQLLQLLSEEGYKWIDGHPLSMVECFPVKCLPCDLIISTEPKLVFYNSSLLNGKPKNFRI